MYACQPATDIFVSHVIHTTLNILVRRQVVADEKLSELADLRVVDILSQCTSPDEYGSAADLTLTDRVVVKCRQMLAAHGAKLPSSGTGTAAGPGALLEVCDSFHYT